MIGVNVVCVGKLKEAYWRDACEEYRKRLRAYCRLNIAELPESRLPQKPSESEIKAALSQEGRLMLPYIERKDSLSVALCIEGERRSSEELSKLLDQASVGGASTVNFLIGSSFGLSNETKQLCRLRLSMSKMTFPHQLARVMLLEQIYRAFSICAGAKYHK